MTGPAKALSAVLADHYRTEWELGEGGIDPRWSKGGREIIFRDRG